MNRHINTARGGRGREGEEKGRKPKAGGRERKTMRQIFNWPGGAKVGRSGGRASSPRWRIKLWNIQAVVLETFWGRFERSHKGHIQFNVFHRVLANPF